MTALRHLVSQQRNAVERPVSRTAYGARSLGLPKAANATIPARKTIPTRCSAGASQNDQGSADWAVPRYNALGPATLGVCPFARP